MPWCGGGREASSRCQMAQNQAATMLHASLRLLAATWFIVATAAHAQTVVAGRVVDRTKRAPLDKVAVELLGPRDTILTTSTSAADGAFSLMAPRGGTYRVRLTAPRAAPRMSDALTVAEGEYIAREFAIDV